MSDVFGINVQPDVLAQEDYSWESVILMKGRSAQSAELALIGQLAAAKNREALRTTIPSGFLRMGSISQVAGGDSDLVYALSMAQNGDVLTSETLENSFYVASHGKNWVVVDGMLINFSATEESTSTHNLIKISPTGNYSVVFMEVWRASVAGVPDPAADRSNIKAYGNQSSQASLKNDLFNDAIGYETARRVQVQYRIRTAPLTGMPTNGNPDLLIGMTPQQIKGGIAQGAYSYASMMTAGDPGLYRAGKGDDKSREAFGSVDGYIYAVPMFLIFHRKGNYDPVSNLSGSNSKNDGAPIRPDGLYLDTIYPSDILDLRRVSSAYCNSHDILDKTFTGIASGGLSTSIAKVRDSSGGTSWDTGCTVAIKTDTLGANGTIDGKTILGTLPSSSSVRRQFLAGFHEQLCNVARIAWDAKKDTYKLDVSCFSGNNLRVYVLAMNGEDGTDRSSSFTYGMDKLESEKILEITRNGDLPAEVTYLLYDTTWNRATNESTGFTDVPEQILQQRTIFSDGKFHDNAAQGVPLYLKPRSSSEYQMRNTDRVECLGTEYKDISNFGQVAVLTRTVVEAAKVLVYLENIGGRPHMPGTNQEVLGVRSVRVSGADTFANVENVLITMGTSAIVTIGASQLSAGEEVEVTLYLGTKFSSFSRSGKGVTETYETRWVKVAKPTDGKTFRVNVSDINSVHNRTVAGACALLTGSIKNPVPKAYLTACKATLPGGDLVWEIKTIDGLTNELSSLPSRGGAPRNPTVVTWQGDASVVQDFVEIYVGMRMLSAYTANEQMCVTYTTRGYQGVIPGKLDVDVLSEGPAYLTSLGSGSSQRLTYSFSEARLKREAGTTLLIGFDDRSTLTHGEVLEGDYLSFAADPLLRYRVAEVAPTPVKSGDITYTKIVLADAVFPAGFDSQVSSYTTGFFTRGDQLYWSDAISRLPSREDDGHLYEGLSIVGDQALLKTSGVHVTPIANAYALTLGADGVAARGRLSVQVSNLPGAPSLQVAYPGAFGASGIAVPYKIYQTYLVREKTTGRVYMAVVTSDYTSGKLTVRTSPYLGYDAVDIFEVVGRVQFRGV